MNGEPDRSVALHSEAHARRVAELLGSDLDSSVIASSSAAHVLAAHRAELGVDEHEYERRLAAERPLIESLRARLVPPETWFFRYPDSFEHLRQHAPSPGDSTPFRIASLGCATGAEAFSIVAALDERPGVKVLAIDRNAEALKQARCGRLRRSAVRGEPPLWARDSWLMDREEVVVYNRLRERVEFIESDLFSPALPGRLGTLDAIFCRNLSIYLSSAARARIGALILGQLRPGGWLYLGHAETPAMLQLPWKGPGGSAFAYRHHAIDERTGASPESKKSASKKSKPTARAEASAKPATARATVDEVRALADRGHRAEALAAAEACHRTGDRSAELLEILGTLLLSEGRIDEAERHLRAALYQDPTRDSAALQRTLLAARRRESGEPPSEPRTNVFHG